jgi:hypothetical protein
MTPHPFFGLTELHDIEGEIRVGGNINRDTNRKWIIDKFMDVRFAAEVYEEASLPSSAIFPIFYFYSWVVTAYLDRSLDAWAGRLSGMLPSSPELCKLTNMESFVVQWNQWNRLSG